METTYPKAPPNHLNVPSANWIDYVDGHLLCKSALCGQIGLYLGMAVSENPIVPHLDCLSCCGAAIINIALYRRDIAHSQYTTEMMMAVLNSNNEQEKKPEQLSGEQTDIDYGCTMNSEEIAGELINNLPTVVTDQPAMLNQLSTDCRQRKNS